MTRSTTQVLAGILFVCLGACSADKITDNSKLVRLAVIPPSVTIKPSAQQLFVAGGITSAGDTGVVTNPTWSASAGTITTGGLYTAPAALGTYYVRVTAGALMDSGKVIVDTDSTVLVRIVVFPHSATMAPSTSTDFAALGITTLGDTTIVTNATWSASAGTVTSAGHYTAPASVGIYYVRAHSGTFTDSAMVTVDSAGPAPYFADNFDSYSVGTTLNGQGSNGFTWAGGAGSSGGAAAISADISHSGTQSLKLTYVGVDTGQDDWEEQYFVLKPAGQGLKEVWMEWYVYFPSNYAYRSKESPNNNKLGYLWAETYSVSSDLNSGLEYEGPADGDSVHAHITLRSAPNGTDITNGDAGSYHYGIFDPMTVAGSWHRLRYHVRAATPNGSGGYSENGTFQVWFDDSLIVQSKPTYVIYTTISPANNLWRNGYLMGWANAGYTNNTSFYIDDFKVWDVNPGW
ncbi:MAG TPA: hypothetical protein VMC86_00820 [Gemmatimonadales bacterium]|nr:hypothetical protein [Gemmatimonadales bacterium]